MNIVFHKTQTLRDNLIKFCIQVMYIYLKLQFKFHTIWLEINGHMDLGPIPNGFIYMDFV